MNEPARRRWHVEHAATVRELWRALASGNLTPLRERLAPDARWRAVEEALWNRESAEAIIDVTGSNLAAGLAGEIEEVLESGDRVIVAFGPERHDPGGWPFEDGVRWRVVTFDGEPVSGRKGCWTWAEAIAYGAA